MTQDCSFQTSADSKKEALDSSLRADREAESAARSMTIEGDRPRSGRSARIKRIPLVLIVTALIAFLFWLVRYETRNKFFQETNDAKIAADAVTVSSRINGYVARVLVADNQDVKLGQPLLWIDPANYHAQAAQAEAQIAQSEASADSARASLSEHYATIEQSYIRLAAARDKAMHDAAEVERYIPLAASGAETRQQLEQLREVASQSAQDERSLAAALKMQQRRTAAFTAQIRGAAAQEQGARARLEAAKIDVEATVVRAAVDGRVGDKAVTVGQYATAGARLLTIVPLGQLYIIANFKETQLSLMRSGQPAKITVDAFPSLGLHGRVESVSPGTGAQFALIPPQNATGNFTKIVQRVPVRVSIEATPEAKRLLLPGLSVNVSVDTIAAKRDLDTINSREKQRKIQGR